MGEICDENISNEKYEKLNYLSQIKKQITPFGYVARNDVLSFW